MVISLLWARMLINTGAGRLSAPHGTPPLAHPGGSQNSLKKVMSEIGGTMTPKIGIRTPFGGILWASGLQNDVRMTSLRHHFWGLAPKPWNLRFCCYPKYLMHVNQPQECSKSSENSMHHKRSQWAEEETSKKCHCRAQCFKKLSKESDFVSFWRFWTSRVRFFDDFPPVFR